MVHLYPASHWNSIKAPTGGGEWEFLWNIPLEFYCSVNVNLILSSGKTWIIFLSSQFTSISASAYKSASSKYALEVDLIGIHNWLPFECWLGFYFIQICPVLSNHHRVAILENAFECFHNIVVYFTVFVGEYEYWIVRVLSIIVLGLMVQLQRRLSSQSIKITTKHAGRRIPLIPLKSV